MSRQQTAMWLHQKRVLLFASVTLAAAILVVALWPVFPASGAAGNASAVQTVGQAPIVFQVHPTFVKYPASRIKNHGIWFVGAGLEPDQEFKIRMVWGAKGMETDVTSVLAGLDKDRGGVFANIHGAFAQGFERGFRGVAGDFLFYGEWEPVSFRLHDALTGDLLAVAPMILCGPEEDENWCNMASEVVPIK
jgi:hypothetical protein